jgi:hypothetical protein
MGSDSVRRGVEMGYRVIDDYVKQGASAANAFSSPSRARVASSHDLSKMTERMMQYASDFTSLWYDAMGMIMGNMNEGMRADAGTSSGSTSGSSDTAKPTAERSSAILGHSRIVLDVKSTRPLEVIVALDEPHYSGAFTVEALKARTGNSHIAGAEVEPASEPQGAIRVRVHVAADVAPGRYTGAIVDAVSGKPKGRLTVTIGK